MSVAAPTPPAISIGASPLFSTSAPAAAAPFSNSIVSDAVAQQDDVASSPASAGMSPRPRAVPDTDTEIVTFGRISFSGAVGSVLIALQAQGSSAAVTTDREAEHGFAMYRFAQSLAAQADPGASNLVTVEAPSMPSADEDQLRLAA